MVSETETNAAFSFGMAVPTHGESRVAATRFSILPYPSGSFRRLFPFAGLCNNLRMEPLLSIQLFEHMPFYRPGDTLKCDYQIDAVGVGEIQAVEASVLWYTEGKGDEDMGIHFFERRIAADEPADLRELKHFEVELPNSPLSYVGALVQVFWCVRLRAFLLKGKESALDHPFQLGNLVPNKSTTDE